MVWVWVWRAGRLDLLERIERVVASYRVLLVQAQVDVGAHERLEHVRLLHPDSLPVAALLSGASTVDLGSYQILTFSWKVVVGLF